MKKKTTFTAIILAFAITFSIFSASCGEGGESEAPAPPIKPYGEDYIVCDVEGAPDENDPKTAIFAALGALKTADFYETTTTGKTVANVLIKYEQTIEGRAIKRGGEYFTSSRSTSAFVKVYQECFVKDNELSYRFNDDAAAAISKSDYLDKYGVAADKLLSGHVYNDESVKSATLKEKKDGVFVYEITLDKEKAHSRMIFQMKEFGGLSGYPAFTSDTVATLTIDKNYRPLLLTYESNYRISLPVLGSPACTESETITFNYDGAKDIPSRDIFLSALTA